MHEIFNKNNWTLSERVLKEKTNLNTESTKKFPALPKRDSKRYLMFGHLIGFLGRGLGL